MQRLALRHQHCQSFFARQEAEPRRLALGEMRLEARKQFGIARPQLIAHRRIGEPLSQHAPPIDDLETNDVPQIMSRKTTNIEDSHGNFSTRHGSRPDHLGVVVFSGAMRMTRSLNYQN